ncbi:MAG: amidophosphoribosyltransferase, partial [Spirochaetales bacterium]|nr:amidophosphoribosyltransferase [Spirochaetales bacterium]
MFDELKEECGVFGISLKNPSEDVMYNMYMGLFSLQHRGQESGGVAYFDNNSNIQVVKSAGLVAEKLLPQLPLNYPCNSAIGHVRYSTKGTAGMINAQPLLFKCNKGEVAIANNGQLPNYDILKEELISNGAIFQTSSDSEILVHLMSNIPGNDFESSLISSIKKLDGAFSMLVMGDKNKIAAFKDPYGFKPLAYGKLGDQGYVFSSETAALNVLGVTDINFLEPGELIICENGEIKQKLHYSDKKKASQCVFELVYFARPDSSVFSESVHQFRFNSGRMLAKNRKKDTDIVISVPDSGNIAALGFARESGIPFDMGLMRNHYAGRTFIKTTQKQREEAVKIKLNPIKSVIEGKTISIVDDS